MKEAGMLAIVMEAWRRIRQTWLWRFRPRHGNVFIENGIWIIIVVLALILPIEALRNAIVTAYGSIVSNLNAIP